MRSVVRRSYSDALSRSERSRSPSPWSLRSLALTQSAATAKHTDDPKSRAARFSSNHSMSSRLASPHPVDAGEGNGDGDKGVALCPPECITGSASACHSSEEETRVPRHNATCLGYGGARREPLTDREAIRAYRTLMLGLADFDDEAEPTPAQGEELRRDGIRMRAFWLTTYGSLVCVEEPSKDLKFCKLRRDNLRTALALWTTKPELCAQGVKASSAAHAALIEMCGEASRLSRGRFYNLYARYLLPVETEEKAKAGCPEVLLARRQTPYRRRHETPVDERSITTREIRTQIPLELLKTYACPLSDRALGVTLRRSGKEILTPVCG
ncbi:hypothetical protein Q5P01_017880 [Channa striata]|uniref:Uncharacterized protein n=1 Tax=Channa striata TaxID=64152 RepID=A0AA88M3Z6_CHASR|nr:hypothetical protein Q5P01_017880 [Channa striata]